VPVFPADPDSAVVERPLAGSVRVRATLTW
jgi:hypothetical protein